MPRTLVRAKRRRRAVANAAALALALGAAGPPPYAAAQSPSPAPAPAPADCALVDAAAAGRILGYPVGAPDETSRAGGVCFYAARSMTEEGVLSYAVVTPARLSQRRPLYAVFARRCAGVAEGAPRAALCETYRKLAAATDLETAYSAETGVPGATPVAELDASAVATPGALYVRRGTSFLELVVRRGDALDLERSVELARLLLQRLGR